MTIKTPKRLTPLDSKNQHLYFTTQSVTADGRWLLIISKRSGTPNLWAVDMSTGEASQVSDASALQYSYVYADGGPSGFCKASPVLDAVRRRIYWVQDNALWRRALGDGVVGPLERLADIPGDGWLGFSHVSADGRYFVIPVADKAAFGPGDVNQVEQMKYVASRMIAGGLGTQLVVVDVETGTSRIWAKIPFWVTHVQFCPIDGTRMIFNSEGSWTVDGDPHSRVWAAQADGTYRKLFHLSETEHASHENWSPDGTFITSHGYYDGKYSECGWVQAHAWDGTLLWRVPVENVPIAHATCLNDCNSFAIDDRDGWISILTLDVTNGSHSLRRLCEHGTSWKNQDVHPHPVSTPDGRYLIFSSDYEGSPAVYRVETK